MEVVTPDDGLPSLGALARYAGTAGALSAVLTAPVLAVPGYARAVGAVLWLSLFGLAARAALSAVFALAAPTSPAVESDDDLPTASVLVTAYNEADVLAGTVAACRDLDYPDEKLEVVLACESASTDGTATVAAAAAADDPRVRVVERDAPPGGKAAATNHALSHASGEVVAVLDADQRPEPAALRRAVGWFRDPAVWCVKGRCYGSNPGDSPLALCATVERHLTERAEFPARDVLGGFALFTGGQAFFRADALDALGPFDEDVLLEDVEMACRIHARGRAIRVAPDVVTREGNPVTLAAWWSQRERWARGGMQVARRHLDRLVRDDALPWRTRVDAALTFGALLAVPPLLLASPVLLFGAAPTPAPLALVALLLAPVLALAPVFAADARAGRDHAPSEYLAPLALWPYAALQSLAVVVAFLDEFVLRRPAVYVTSARAE